MKRAESLSGKIIRAVGETEIGKTFTQETIANKANIAFTLYDTIPVVFRKMNCVSHINGKLWSRLQAPNRESVCVGCVYRSDGATDTCSILQKSEVESSSIRK